MKNGIINVRKEKGFTSFDVVAKLRGILGQKKIGHTGTLDPDATGVLPVCLGKATKVCELLTDKDKEYEAVLLLGKKTDTLDISGTVLEEKDVTVTEQKVRTVMQRFVGEIEQIPPMYSALKVDGKKLCDLARAGVTVERKPRKRMIYEITIKEIALPRVSFRVSCARGTYIRTLCEDIGEALGCGGCVESLVRTRVADFTLEQSFTLSQIEQMAKDGTIDSAIRPIDSVFAQYPAVTAKPEYEKMLYNGNRMALSCFSDYRADGSAEPVRVYDWNGAFIGIYRIDDAGLTLKPVKIFME